MAATHRRRLLLVEDDLDFLKDAEVRFGRAFECVSTPDFGEAVELCVRKAPDAVILDLIHQATGEPRGFEVLKDLQAECPDVPVIMWTEDTSLEAHLRARSLGAFLYVTKVAGPDEIAIVVEAAIDERRLALQKRVAFEELDRGWGEFVFASETMRVLLAEVGILAKTNRPILITGERGSGKGVLAREIHRRSPRPDEHFVTVDCPALSPLIVESELFGHEKGSFSGAIKQRTGQCEAAIGGTLFLDEVGDIPRDTQVKLRRLVDEGLFKRVGSNEWRKCNAKIIAATNRDLYALSERGEFASDLLDRLSGGRVHIPPLRERPADIPVLARHFAAIYGRKYKKCTEVSNDAVALLSHRRWEGNARELKHVIEDACDRCRGSMITAADLPAPTSRQEFPTDYHEARKQNELEFKRKFVAAGLDRHRWDVEAFAEEAGIPRGTVYRLIREVGLEKP